VLSQGHPFWRHGIQSKKNIDSSPSPKVAGSTGITSTARPELQSSKTMVFYFQIKKAGDLIFLNQPAHQEIYFF